MAAETDTMPKKSRIEPVRILPEAIANKIAAGEVIERPASVVKELVENALDAGATRVSVRLVAAGRRSIEVVDNGHGMSEQDALLAIERHATSKIRKAEDLDCIATLGFRGEALASMAAVSRFELVTRTAKSESATRIRVDGGILRDVSQVAGPVGTRVQVNRLYFNTPVRAKFLKGITTELSHSLDIVQRHALAHEGVAFQFVHNEKTLITIAENATLRERIALIWGLNFLQDLVEIQGERGAIILRGLIGSPRLTRSGRSHQFFFLNQRPIANRSLQYGFEDGYRGLLTIGRHPVGILLLKTHPRFVDVNIHPAKREVRFRDERAIRDALREMVRDCMAGLREQHEAPRSRAAVSAVPHATAVDEAQSQPAEESGGIEPQPVTAVEESRAGLVEETALEQAKSAGVQTDFMQGEAGEPSGELGPAPFYAPVGRVEDAPLQIFDTYLIVPEQDRLLIVDQHALHERLTYDSLLAELNDSDYASQQLAVPLVIDLPPSHAGLLQQHAGLMSELGFEIEPFGGNTFQVTAICHLYDESKVADAIYRVLDELAQGDLFDKEHFLVDFLRVAVEACRSSVKAGDRLSHQERRNLLDGFRRLRPPYTCPHGRPIITELTQVQMEKSFRRRQ